jgi:hypothetical protein
VSAAAGSNVFFTIFIPILEQSRDRIANVDAPRLDLPKLVNVDGPSDGGIFPAATSNSSSSLAFPGE